MSDMTTNAYRDTDGPDLATTLTVPEAALRLRVTERTIRRWIAAGHIRAYRFGEAGRYRIHPADLASVVKEVA